MTLSALLLLALAFLLMPRDSPPPDTNDLEVKRVELADSDIAWIPMEAALALLDALRATPATIVLMADLAKDPSDLLAEIEGLAKPEDQVLLDALRTAIAEWESTDRREDWHWMAAHDAALPRARATLSSGHDCCLATDQITFVHPLCNRFSNLT